MRQVGGRASGQPQLGERGEVASSVCVCVPAVNTLSPEGVEGQEPLAGD